MNYLEFAIKMELDGEKYYLDQAEKNQGNNLHTVFMMLTKDERMHAEVLRKKFNEVSYELTSNNTMDEYRNVFEGIDDFEDEVKAKPSQLDAYRMALEKEEESIELYEKMLEDAQNNDERELFEFLIGEEKTHYKIIAEIISHLSRAEEWVESAEFGLREDY